MSKVKTYYIYHIPNVKWGLTTNLKRRLISEGYEESDVVELIEIYDIITATMVQEQLNLKHRYITDVQYKI